MVRGLDKFKEYFAEYTGNYVVIGGIARDKFMEEAGFKPKGTKDIDMILIVEALNEKFIKKFWEFIEVGAYTVKEKNADDRKYYRFKDPKDVDFPSEIELFSRDPDLMNLKEGAHLTPIPVEKGLASLSAILLDDEYYHYVIEHSKVEDGLHLAQKEAVICLKAKAFIDLNELRDKGEKIDRKKIRKHHSDIFRLGLTLGSGDNYVLPGGIKADLQQYLHFIESDLPGKELFESIGLGHIKPEEVYAQIKESFLIDKEY